MRSPVDTLIGAADGSLLAGTSHRAQQLKRENCPLFLERNLINILEAVIGTSVLGLFVHDDAAILGPIGNHSAHIVSCDLARLADTITVSPAFFVHFVSNFFQAKIAGRIEIENAFRCLKKASPESPIFRHFISVTGYKCSISQEPGSLRTGLQMALCAPKRAKRGHSNTDPFGLAIGHTIFGPLRDVFGVVLVDDRCELDEQTPHRCRGINLPPRGRQP
mgnify:CR=1 FL=1